MDGLVPWVTTQLHISALLPQSVGGGGGIYPSAPSPAAPGVSLKAGPARGIRKLTPREVLQGASELKLPAQNITDWGAGVGGVAKNRNFLPYSSGGWQSRARCRRSLRGWRMAAFSLCLRPAFPLCVQVPGVPLASPTDAGLRGVGFHPDDLL